MSRGRRRKYTFGLIGVFILMWGAVWSVAQNQTPAASPTFSLMRVIGKAQPRGLRYDKMYDRLAWINASGQLTLADATTYEDIAILTPDDPGTRLNDYRFSPDGRWLAVARDKQVDLWDVQNAKLAATYQTDASLGLEGPLSFSDDSRQLVFQSRVPAPQATRRSENDTILIAWVWDTVAARGEGQSELPNRVIAQPLFDYRNGFLLGKGRKAIAGLPSRLRTVEVNSDGIQTLAESDDPNRIEVDPIDAWESEADGWMMLRTRTGNLVQVDPTSGQFLPIAAGQSLQLITQQTMDAFHRSNATQPIGAVGDVKQNPLRARLLGDDYRATFNYEPVTMYLIDVLQPVTPSAGVPGLLIYTRSDSTGQGTLEFLNVPNSRAVRLHPNGRDLLIQNADGSQQITIYNLSTGTVKQVYYPNQLDANVVSYNADGTALIVGLERFETRTQTQTFFDPQYFVNTGQMFFTQDSKSIITLDNGTYQQWEVATGRLLRQEYFYARGEVIMTAPDGTRLLTRVDLPTGQSLYEVVDVAGRTRPTLTIAPPINTTVLGVYPDATWEQFFVLIGDNASTRPESRIQAALFRMGSASPLWVVGSGDLPNAISDIRWLDAKTLAFQYTGEVVPAPRIDNIQYAASGLPTCLVDGLSDAGMRWMGLWDKFNQTMSATDLDTLAKRLCQTVHEAANPAAADAAIAAYLLVPTATPIDVVGTPRTPRIPGVPECITQRFTTEALQYAQDWRTITADMTEAQITQLTQLVCQGLTGDAAPQGADAEYGTARTQYLTIDVNNLSRVIHNGGIPQPRPGPNLDLIARTWRNEKRFELGNFALSPNGKLVAQGDGRFISIYSVDPSYVGIAETATASAMPQGTAEKFLSLRPTAIAPAEVVQATYMPTFTPTWVPTTVPLPAGTPLPLNKVEATCPVERVPLSSLAPGEIPDDTLFVQLWDNQNTRSPWQFDLRTGKIRLRDDIPSCNYSLSCSSSPNNQWILYMDQGATWVSRWDGTQAAQLLTPEDNALQDTSITWVGPHTLEWRFQAYRPKQSINPVTLIQRYDAETGVLSTPIEDNETIPQINDLATELVTRQPILEHSQLLSLNVREGRRYYWHDRQTGQITLFLTLTGAQTLSYEWQPDGTTFYYGLSDQGINYAYEMQTQTAAPAEFHTGLWSPDGQKTVETYIPTAREVYDYGNNQRELPRLIVWDSQAKQRVRYCLPGTDQNQGVSLITWSPDSRYLLVQAALIVPSTYEVNRPTLLILDAETGRVIDLGSDIQSVTAWTTLTAKGGAQ